MMDKVHKNHHHTTVKGHYAFLRVKVWKDQAIQ
jgi:hypothetical protein